MKPRAATTRRRISSEWTTSARRSASITRTTRNSRAATSWSTATSIAGNSTRRPRTTGRTINSKKKGSGIFLRLDAKRYPTPFSLRAISRNILHRLHADLLQRPLCGVGLAWRRRRVLRLDDHAGHGDAVIDDGVEVGAVRYGDEHEILGEQAAAVRRRRNRGRQRRAAQHEHNRRAAGAQTSGQ